jgi:S1-C subfamily serine protease
MKIETDYAGSTEVKWHVAVIMLFALCMGARLQAQQTNLAHAFFELEMAKAERGDSKGQCVVAECYARGYGTPQDMAKALTWFRKAAEQGNAEAEDGLGVFYRDGCGTPRDAVEAVKWFRKSAEQGFSEAQANIGTCYDQGQGVPKDYVESYKWRLLAAAQGSDLAKRAATALEGVMTPEQIAEGQRLAREFVPRKETPGPNTNSSSLLVIDSPVATTTGFFITDDGYLISNYHVVKDAAKVRLLTSAGKVDAKVVRVDAANDLALLRAEGRFAPLPVAASRNVQLGNTVATVGFPDPGLQGFSPKLAKGEIAALAGAGDDARYFQISVPVQPGNSGGALVDEHGNVVGIVSAKLNAAAALASSGALPENVNYAVKSSFLLSFLESVPDVAKKLKEPSTTDRKFEDVVKSAQSATVLVLVY